MEGRVCSWVCFKLVLVVSLSLVCNLGVSAEYTPTEIVRIDCGSDSGKTTIDGVGTFGSDNDTNVVNQGFSIEESDGVVGMQENPGLKQLLESARVFKDPASYRIATQAPGSHWLRFYFDMRALNLSTLSSNNINSSNHPVFSVTVGQSTAPGAGAYPVLNSLDTAIQQLVHGNSFLFYEFYLNVQFTELFVTFTPASPSSYASILRLGFSYAFINGLEFVSAPQDLNAEVQGVIPSNGLTNNSYVPTNYTSSVLQTMYRINVGGFDIDRANDSSLSRAWTNDSTDLVSFEGGTVTQEVAPTKINYQLSLVPDYFAPATVYATARASNIQSFYGNLTWTFHVEPNYKYLVRLHFCELVVTAPGARVFDICINRQLSYKGYDIFSAAKGPNVPVILDFTVEDTLDNAIVVDLGQAANSSIKMDAILNGLEIFKVIDLNSSAQVLPLKENTPTPHVGNTATPGSTFSILFITLLVTTVTVGLAKD